jgi:hypothetical protein
MVSELRNQSVLCERAGMIEREGNPPCPFSCMSLFPICHGPVPHPREHHQYQVVVLQTLCGAIGPGAPRGISRW